MAIKTYTEQLEEVQAAITKVLSNQSYRIGDRQMTRANLGELEAREKRLQTLVKRENGGGLRVRRAEHR